jgi:hypothetical protein
MQASAFVGRVGGLAVALGVGAAVVVGTTGIAWADSSDSESSSQASNSGTEKSDTGTPDSKPSESKAADTKVSESKVSESNASDTEHAAPPKSGVAVSHGGALTSKRATGSTARAAEPVETKPAEEPDTKVAEEPDTKVAEEPDTQPAEEPVETQPVDSAPADTGTAHTTPVGAAPEEASVKRKALPESAGSRRTAEHSATTLTTDTAVRASTVVRTEPVKQAVQQPVAAVASAMPKVVAAVQHSFASAVAEHAMPATAVLAAPATVQSQAQGVIKRLLSAFGLGSLANAPALPSPTWALGAVLTLTSRREIERAIASRSATPTAGQLATALAAAAPSDPAKDYVVTPVAVSSNTDRITNVTGPGGLNDTQYRFGIGGTDLGIMWDNGIPDDPTTAVNEHQVLIAFGDTFSNRTPVRTGVWRNNTLFRSTDAFLNNGMYVADGIQHDPGMFSGSPMSDPRFSREIIGKYGYAVGPEVTIIPTAGISVPGAGKDGATRQYINFMSVRSWDTPGRWTTNYSAIAYSDDNGQNWTVVPPESVRAAAAGRSTKTFISGNQNFQQFAYVKGAVVDATGATVKDPVTGQAETDGYVYAFGTPSGRGGTAYLSRVAEGDILDQAKYEYWNGTSWVANTPSAAKPILPATTTSSFFGLIKTKSYPTVSEMSVQYNEYEKKYVMLYGDKNNNVVMRKADSPQGPWSAPVTLVTSKKMPGLYAPMIHPWSSTDNVADSDQKYLYWNLSTWDDYQVKLMRTDLSKV